jgi:hypothetical protein
LGESEHPAEFGGLEFGYFDERARHDAPGGGIAFG